MVVLRLFVFGMCLSFVCNEEVTLPGIQQSTLCLNCIKSSTIELACAENERIGFEGIYYGGKNIQSCKSGTKVDCQISTPNCCIPDNDNDCIITVDSKGYYESCIGMVSCSITFADDTMVCSTDSSIIKPNYAGISYYCIPEKNFAYLETDSKSNGKVVYLINKDYPVALETSTAFTCSVETKCGKILSISALDIYLGYDTTKGECIHELTIQDNGKFIKKTCFENNQLRRSTYYYSDSHFIILSFTSTSSTIQGYVWLDFIELDLKESVEIICGKDAKQRPSPCAGIQENTTINTTTVTMSYNSTNGTNLEESTVLDDDTSVKTIVLSVMIILLVVVGITLGVYCYKKQKQSKLFPDENVVAPSTSSSAESETELSIRSTRQISTRQRGDDTDDESYDHSATESPTSDNWRKRRRGFLPPLVDHPSAPMRKNTISPRIGEQPGPRRDLVSVVPDIRRPLPRIASRTRRKIEPRE